MLIIDVHGRDIVDGFVRESVLNAKEFAWESQLRFYWDRDIDNCIIRQCTGSFQYGYEYMGLNGRLVITALTDRCYMTLTQALTFKLGGAPAGPAGTGKTETVKDLAKGLALPCFVINCGDAMLPRHWNKLMEVTGVVFEYNPRSLTLEEIFKMNLARYQESIEEIVNEGRNLTPIPRTNYIFSR